jgi:hypothetical protein
LPDFEKRKRWLAENGVISFPVTPEWCWLLTVDCWQSTVNSQQSTVNSNLLFRC